MRPKMTMRERAEVAMEILRHQKPITIEKALEQVRRVEKRINQNKRKA